MIIETLKKLLGGAVDFMARPKAFFSRPLCDELGRHEIARRR